MYPDQDWAEVESFLNAQDHAKGNRRKSHNLARTWYEQTDVTWSLTLCARHHGKPFENSNLAQETIAALRFYRDRGACSIFAYCLMPDHFHVVIKLLGASEVSSSKDFRPPPSLLNLMRRYKRYTTTQLAWKLGLHGSLWQREFYDHAIRNREDLEAQCNYVLDNPVRKGLVAEWRLYPWVGIMDEWR